MGLLAFAPILSALLAIFGFILHQKSNRSYDHTDIEKFGKKYELNHPQYYEEKRAKQIENDKKIGLPSAPIDTPFEDVFLKSRKRNKMIGTICVLSGLSITIITALLTLI